MKAVQKKLPRKLKHWEKDLLESLTDALTLNKQRYFGIFISEDDESQLAKDRDSFTALGAMYAMMHRNITQKDTMRSIRNDVYKAIFDGVSQKKLSHPGELFVASYLYTHVKAGLISDKKYSEILKEFSQFYAQDLGWRSNEYTPV